MRSPLFWMCLVHGLSLILIGTVEVWRRLFISAANASGPIDYAIGLLCVAAAVLLYRTDRRAPEEAKP